MAGPNPRRRPSPVGQLKLDPAVHCVMSLQKSATFHSTPSPVAGPDDPQLHVPSLPKRTPTCLGLTDACDDDRVLRVARWIRDVDQTLVDTGASATASFDRRRDEELPLPAGVLAAVAPTVHRREEDIRPVDSISDVCTISDSIGLDHPGPPDRADLARRSSRPSPRRARRQQRQVSDSGIGSSVSGTISSPSEVGVGYGSIGENPATRTTTIGRTISLIPTAAVDGPSCLSPHAARLVQKHIVEPLLRHDALSDFHPLVRDVPRQIGDKELLCVRDLEKRLIWSAPGCSKSDRLYLLFCNTTIQCIHTAVTYIGEHEHRRPRDAPYTNGYFVDLVEQVREYARMMAASRERRAAAASAAAAAAASAEADEAEFSASDELKLVGGLSQTGRRAKLVRVKKGKTLALDIPPTASATGRQPSDGGSLVSTSKRSLSEDEDDEDDEHLARRSMARRRKLGPGETVSAPVLHSCSRCSKEFKRPCDLTKHEKTHSRPWKCQEPTCKFHSHGWPTEKERDRHFNDKHSSSPRMYQCHFHPCTYQSKRLSNCKQHMEKSHGWTYDRAKGNGNGNGNGNGSGSGSGRRSGAGEASRQPSYTPSAVPETATPASTSTEAHEATSPAPFVQKYPPLAHTGNATGLIRLSGGEVPPQSGANPTQHDQTDWLPRPESEAERATSQPLDAGQLDVMSPLSHAVDAFSDDAWLNAGLQAAGDFSGFDTEYTELWLGLGPFDARQGQLPTPQQSAEQRAYGSFSRSGDRRQILEDLDLGIGPSTARRVGRVEAESSLSRLAPPLSSVGQAQVTLSSPAFDDETFGDYVAQLGSGAAADFQLYDPNEPAFGGTGEATGTSTTQVMFPDLPTFRQPPYGHSPEQQPRPPQLRDSQQQHEQLPGCSQAAGSAASQQGYAQALTTPPVDFLADFMDTEP